MNANGICLMEIEDFASLRGSPWVSFWPNAIHAQVSEAIALAGSGKGSRFSADCPTAGGTLKSWEVVVWPVLDSHGAPYQIMSISRDVTATRRLEEQRTLFTRELAHRIKNTFAVVDGLIVLSSRTADDAKTFAASLRERLSGLGRALSYMAPPEFVGLPNEQRSMLGLLEVLLAHYGGADGDEHQIFISGDDLTVSANVSTALALIFNELATNALKYGGLSGRQGRVDLELRRTDGKLLVVWRERSARKLQASDPSTALAPGFGTTLLENAITRQLGGSFEREWRPDGLKVTMSFAVSRLEA